MPRHKIYAERLHVTLPAGAKKRIDAVVERGEDRLDVIRAAIEIEVERRERARRKAKGFTPADVDDQTASV